MRAYDVQRKLVELRDSNMKFVLSCKNNLTTRNSLKIKGYPHGKMKIYKITDEKVN